MLQDVCVYPDPEERKLIFDYLDTLEVEYHKEYKRFNKIGDCVRHDSKIMWVFF
eukprot:COSAG02_NODE_6412_length_3588_cov_1.797650_6_plen_54_part_00